MRKEIKEIKLSKAAQEILAHEVVSKIDKDRSNMAEHVKNAEKYAEAYTLKNRPKKETDLGKLSQAMVTLFPQVCTEFQALAYPMLVDPKSIVKHNDAIQNTDYEVKCRKKASYMNYILNHKIPDYRKNLQNTMLNVPIYGEQFRKIFWDPVEEKINVKNVSTVDFIISNADDSIEESERYAHILRESGFQIQRKGLVGYYNKNYKDLIETKATAFDSTNELQKIENDNSGIDESMSNIETLKYENYEAYIHLNLHDYDKKQENKKKPYIVTVNRNNSILLRIIENINPATGKPHKVFSHFTMLSQPNTLRGVGYGLLLHDLCESASSILRILIDTGRKNSMTAGFVDSDAIISGTNIKVKENHFVQLKTHGENINQKIKEFPFKEPSQVMFLLYKELKDQIENVTSVNDLSKGKLPSSDTPAAAIHGVMNESMKVPSFIVTKLHDSLTKEVEAIYELVVKHIEVEEVFFVTEGNPPQDTSEYSQMLQDIIQTFSKAFDYGIQLTTDSNVMSRSERVFQAQQAYQLVMSNPITANDPNKVMVAMKELLSALGMKEDKLNYLSQVPAPPEPPAPLNLSQEEELSMIIRGEAPQVLPEQDHAQHLQVIENFKQGQFISQLDEGGMQLLEQHEKEHISYLYLINSNQQQSQ